MWKPAEFDHSDTILPWFLCFAWASHSCSLITKKCSVKMFQYLYFLPDCVEGRGHLWEVAGTGPTLTWPGVTDSNDRNVPVGLRLQNLLLTYFILIAISNVKVRNTMKIFKIKWKLLCSNYNWQDTLHSLPRPGRQCPLYEGGELLPGCSVSEGEGEDHSSRSVSTNFGT